MFANSTIINRKLKFLIFYMTIFLIFNGITSQMIELNMKKVENYRPLSLPNHHSFISVENNKKSYLIEGTSMLDLIGLREGLYTIKLKLGYPEQEFEVIVDTGSFLLWIPSEDCKNCFFSKNKFQINQSKSLHKKTEYLQLKYISGKIAGNVSHDKLTLGNSSPISINKFNFLLSDTVDAPVKVDGIVGLARSYSNYKPEFSIINSLHSSGAIKNRIFSQNVIQEGLDDKNSKIFIGDIPPEISSNIENLTRCRAINDNSLVKSYWTCNLKKVLMSKKKSISKTNIFENEDSNDEKYYLEVSNGSAPAIFDTGSNVIIAPLNLYAAFKKIFFKEHLEKGTCSNLYDSDNSKGFKCADEVIITGEFPKIHLLFDNDITYELSIDDLFYSDYEGKIFRIIFSNVPGNGWLLGQPFLKQYHMVFDHEDDSVGIYHKNNEENKKVNSFKDFKVVLADIVDDESFIYRIMQYKIPIIITVVVLLAILNLVFIVKKCKNNKQKRETLLEKEDGKKVEENCHSSLNTTSKIIINAHYK